MAVSSEEGLISSPLPSLNNRLLQTRRRNELYSVPRPLQPLIIKNEASWQEGHFEIKLQPRAICSETAQVPFVRLDCNNINNVVGYNDDDKFCTTTWRLGTGTDRVEKVTPSSLYVSRWNLPPATWHAPQLIYWWSQPIFIIKIDFQLKLCKWTDLLKNGSKGSGEQRGWGKCVCSSVTQKGQPLAMQSWNWEKIL